MHTIYFIFSACHCYLVYILKNKISIFIYIAIQSLLSNRMSDRVCCVLCVCSCLLVENIRRIFFLFSAETYVERHDTANAIKATHILPNQRLLGEIVPFRVEMHT